MSLRPWLVAAPCLGLVLAGCNPAPPEEDPFGEPDPAPTPDTCNLESDAMGVPDCVLALGVERTEYIGLPGDVDWFSATLPTMTGRSLLHLWAGIQAQSTPVNLSVNVLRNDDKSIANVVDEHDQGVPKPIELILRGSLATSQLLFRIGDAKSGQHYDYRHPYVLKFEVVDDPDVNEPNDTVPTVLPLVANADQLVGTQSGYLATTDDVDRFELTLPTARKVLHLRISAPPVDPAPPYRLSYTLFDAQNVPVAEGHMDTAFATVELATARTTSGGKYVLEVKGFTTDLVKSAPGDLRLKYTIDAQVLPEGDPNEPNNTLETASAQALTAPGRSVTVHGRLGQVPDADWFGFDLAATSRPTVLHYKLTPPSGAGRFPALPGPKDRQVRIFTEVKDGATLADRQHNCMTKDSACPHREDAPADQLGLVDSYCGLTPPRCMLSAREEHAKYPGLRNFEGTVPVAAHSGTVRYFVLVEDDGNNWADDADYTLDVEWRDDADEAARVVGGVEQAQSRTISVDTGASTFPAPPAGAGFELTGKLSYGYGFWRGHDALKGEGVRGPADYDAFTSDTDRYELVFPAGLAAPLDRTWELQWEVEKDASGKQPYDVVLDVEFCDGTTAGSCHSVKRSVGYQGGNLGSWHSAGVMGAPFQPVFSKEDLSDRTRVTGLAWGCFCIEPRFIKGGKFYVTVVAVDRDSYADTTYRVRTALTSYPKPYNGGSCPAPSQAADGSWLAGCKFAQ